jgi:hypothetical protein
MGVGVDRLRRVTELFVVGKEIELGVDEIDGRPVLIWVQKLNAFEEEESRQDGLAARGMKLRELSNPDSPDMAAVERQLAGCGYLELQEILLDHFADEDRGSAKNDVDSTEEWNERLPEIQRYSELLDDDSVDEADSRRTQFKELWDEYQVAIEEALKKRRADRRSDLRTQTEEQIREQLIERIRGLMGAMAFLEAKRVTEVFFALRDCRAIPSKDSSKPWNHTSCMHPRLMPKRADVRDLPAEITLKVIAALEEITVPMQEAGNSDAPTGSSVSSEQANTVEDSVPSGLKETRRKPVVTSPSLSAVR